jgi:MoaA/NifB/PqqE/SkfB family radical SAM enzyme
MFDKWQKACVFLTRKCNIKCRGCNVINFDSSYEMTTLQWCKAFDIMKQYKVGFVVLFGGEPTLRDDLPELVTHLNQIDMPHTIITNGIKLLANEKYYDKLLAAKPYGISTSVNAIDAYKLHYGDERKSEVGVKLLMKLKKDYSDMDLVANMAVTAQNISALPKMVMFFSKQKIWSILSFFHVRPQKESMYWWYRGPITEDNRKLVFQDSDYADVKRVSEWFVRHYDELLLHNQKSYFEVWPNFGISQDWHCSVWACPAVNPDGSLMACIDRPLSKPFTIFDIPTKGQEILQNFQETIDNCSAGCFWDHMYETNKFAKENKENLGKQKFSHQCDSDE